MEKFGAIRNIFEKTYDIIENFYLNNRVENLEWCTQKVNIQQEFDERRRPTKKVMQLTKEGILCRVYESIAIASRITNVRSS